AGAAGAPAAADEASVPAFSSAADAPSTIAADPLPGTSPFEPAPSLPATRVATVGEPAAVEAKRGRSGLRWALALVGVLIVAAVSLLIVSLVGGRPATSTAIGYMPATTFSYTEVRIDLPGDQRPKLASFLKAFPGFSDQSAIDPKLDDIFDRLVRAASKDKQSWTNDIKPWFGGQVAIGVGLPDSVSTSTMATSGANNSLVVVTITDRAKAIAWLTKSTEGLTINRSTHGDADLFIPAINSDAVAVAINDKVMLAGTTTALNAAIDSGGKGTLDQNVDVKAAIATLDKDYVMFGVVRIRAYAEAALKLMSVNQPGVLDKTQIDETTLALIPTWQAQSARFENDAIVASTVSPPWAIGYDSTNGPSDVLGHVPAKTILYFDLHDVGPTLNAIIAKFRVLEELKPAFAQFDQAVSLLGGSDAVFGWWGDTALVVTPLSDGTIGGGLVIHPRDAALADRLFSTLNGFIAIGGGSTGVVTRSEDHNGTKITILDLSAVPGVSSTSFPPGFKPEFAWATNADVAVMGYGSEFVKAVLDAGPGTSLGDDARFKGLLGRVGSENMGVSFLDIAAFRGLLEPIAQAQSTSDQWAYYTKEIQPYLKPIDAVIGAVRKDGNLDRGTGAFTVTGP
ncbi:MAG TPA: DUF3352 domain-containing protein, partial [Candidatus Limnocylindrales bacterium]|nr:DUF3352 domain-containing protein [Candidatus Limnocylindrales bacterium]